jgi:hypothetical protein
MNCILLLGEWGVSNVEGCMWRGDSFMAVRYDRCVLCESILPAMNMQPVCG